MSPTRLAYARLALRGLQFVCSLFTLAFAASGFYGGGATHSSTFVLLMGYTGMLYTLWYLIAVEVFHHVSRPAVLYEQAMDAALAITLLVAGICLAASDFTNHCGYGWHCHNLRAATAFDFIAMFFFLVSFALTFVSASSPAHGLSDVQVEEPVPYHKSTTPTSGSMSPIGGPASKIAKKEQTWRKDEAKVSKRDEACLRLNKGRGRDDRDGIMRKELANTVLSKILKQKRRRIYFWRS
ncbi:hypothetical protein PsorP6_013217 [Peronosclerospora sorghi]|uniref:Uncharacterized protein n=1 Tax=Peronosclerospora sorghi TaxID=230839 RepID=A0ACC0WJJ8_9STRA|nr:hypothetical protein PsorP6_013217 [Peronosclerospora sorghi]